MENAVEALKIAFAVMMFVLALSLSISSFSQANSTIDAIISMRDRETEYTYVEPTANLSRTVGIETVVSSMYRAFEQNIEIYFKDEDGNTIPLFYKTQIDVDGYLVKDSTGAALEIYSIDKSNEDVKYDKMHLDIILGGTSVIEDVVNETLASASDELRESYIEMYSKKLQNTDYSNGLYEELKDEKFTELFGEYYQGEGASEIKKRVITYQIQPN